jgi:phosphate transport system substrate-binding protein
MKNFLRLNERRHELILSYISLFIIILVLLSFSNKVDILNDDKNLEGTINISGTRFLFPLIEKWAVEFNKEYPNIKITVKQGVENMDISAIAYPILEKDPSKGFYTTVAKFALVPIVNAKNPAWEDLEQKGITKKDFQNIYFQGEESVKTFGFKSNSNTPLKVYSRGACASATFTNKFGKSIKDLNNVGGKIEDDEVLLDKVLTDSFAIAYNNLGFVYDLSTRSQKNGIRVIPIDLNGNGKIDKNEKVYDNLDELIYYIENLNPELPPTGEVTFIYKDTKPELGLFINWVVKNGYHFNHEYGFIRLDQQYK